MLFSSGDDGDLSAGQRRRHRLVRGHQPLRDRRRRHLACSAGCNKNGKKTEFGWGTYRAFLANADRQQRQLHHHHGHHPRPPLDGLTVSTTFAFYSGSGGGISLVEPQPAYQTSRGARRPWPPTLNEASGYSDARCLTPHAREPRHLDADADPYTGYLYPANPTRSPATTAITGCTKLYTDQPWAGILRGYAEGGTSLASPLMAGVIAIMDQARMVAGKPVVGFVNPLFYGSSIGATYQSSGINDVKPPTHPFAFLRGYANNLNEVRVVTVNSAPFVVQPTPFPLLPCNLPKGVCEGLNDVFNYTTSGYDDVTGLGVPWIPELIKD